MYAELTDQAPRSRSPTRTHADVSEFRLRNLMQSSASPFVISNAVRDTWLSTGIHPLVGQIADYLLLANAPWARPNGAQNTLLCAAVGSHGRVPGTPRGFLRSSPA